MKKHIYILLFVTASLSAQTDSVKTLNINLENLSQQNSLVGFGVALFSKDAVSYSKGFGYADKEKKIPYSINTVQKIASISKLFLAVSLMKAQELKLLSLDDSVNDYLPFPLINKRIKGNNITIRQLAAHTSGLKKRAKYDLKALYFPTKLPKITNELPFGFRRFVMNQFVKMVNKNENAELQDYLYKIYHPKGKWYSKKHFAKIESGEKEVYSNQGASFLALIIEKASGMKYSDFVQKYILSELEMKDSGFDFEMQNYPQEKKAALYHSNSKIPNDYKLILYPAGGFETSIKDFSQFMVTMADGLINGNQLLTKESYNEMAQTPNNADMSHAVLWEVYPNHVIGHQGNIAGVVTYAYYNRKKDKGYIFFTNTAGTKKNDKDISVIKELLINIRDQS